MGLFAGIKAAQVYKGGAYVQPGVYLAKVLKCKADKTRKTEAFFAVEMEVLESSDLKAHPIGATMTWMVMLKHDAALGNIKHFLNVAADIPENEIDEPDVDEAVAEANPLAGTVLRLFAFTTKTKALKDFTKVTFMPGNTSAAAAADAHKAASAKSEAKSAQA